MDASLSHRPSGSHASARPSWSTCRPVLPADRGRTYRRRGARASADGHAAGAADGTGLLDVAGEVDVRGEDGAGRGGPVLDPIHSTETTWVPGLPQLPQS